MQTLRASTEIYCDPDTVYEFLLDFTNYAEYASPLTEVRQLSGTGGTGTEYELVFDWWVVEYTPQSTVTSTDHPNRIEWEITSDLDAHGMWLIEPLDTDGQSDGSKVQFIAYYDPHTVSIADFNIPRVIPVEGVIDKAVTVAVKESERLVERVVEDLEGERRSVTVRVEHE